MAFSYFSLEPSADIHLILNPASGKKLQLKVLSYDFGLPAPTDITSLCSFSDHDTSIVTVSNSGELMAQKEGRTFMKVSYKVSNTVTHELVARVWVHQSVVNVWIGNNQASVNAGKDNLVISVYALFSDQNVGDITGHGYMTFQSSNTVLASVDSKTGRVTGKTPGNVIIRGSYDGQNFDLNVTVKGNLSTPKNVQPIGKTGPIHQCRNLLFLGEGFDKEQKFVSLVNKIAHRMTHAPYHNPFPFLKNDINIWAAFEPSNEKGISIGPWLSSRREMIPYDKPANTSGNYSLFDLIRMVGMPEALWDMDTAKKNWSSLPGFDPNKLEDDIFNHWLYFYVKELYQARDSLFGLIYGRRPGERVSEEGPLNADNSWYLPLEPFISLLPDIRRLTSHLEFGIFEYLESLRIQPGIGLPNYQIGLKWKLGGVDQGLVIILVNDECDGGIFDPYNYSVVTVGRKNYFDESSINFDNPSSGDHEPNPSNSNTNFEILVSTVLHELGHAFFLGDEYEDIRYTHNNPPKLTLDDIKTIEIYNNITARETILNAGVIDPSCLKWARINRVEKASALAATAVNGTSPNTIEIDLLPGQGKDWEQGMKVHLRTRNINNLININEISNIYNIDDINKKTRFWLYPSYRRHAALETPELTIKKVDIDHLVLEGASLPAPDFYTSFNITSQSLVRLKNAGVPDVILQALLTIANKVVIDESIFLNLIKNAIGNQQYFNTYQSLILNHANNSFPKGSIIYIPKKVEINNIEKPLGLVLRRVCTYMKDNNVPLFPKSRQGQVQPCDCSEPRYGKAWPKNIPLYVYIKGKEKYRLIGLYEGGGTYNCHVYRPTGSCKMREHVIEPESPTPQKESSTKTEYPPFCFVCQYIIVNEVNPALHPRLDSNYPGKEA